MAQRLTPTEDCGGTMATRRSQEEVRSALLEAGAKLIVRQGFERTNSNQIARLAGVGVGTFYRHFPDKAALLEALEQALVAALRERSRAGVDAHADLETQVRALIGVALDQAEERPEAYRVVAAEAASASPRRRHPGALRLSTRPIADRLAALQAAGTLDPRIDPTVAAKAFESMQSGVIAWWLEDPARAKRSAVHETLVRLHPALATRRSDGSAVGAESAQHLEGGVDQHAGTGPQRR